MHNLMSFPSVSLCFLLFSLLHVIGTADDCTPVKCSKKGPEIQTPFRLKDKQPEHCGYPGFDVYCNEKNEALLELPFSVKVAVDKINYASQTLRISDPEGCLIEKIPHLNLSSSSFQFQGIYDSPTYNYIFNCSPRSTDAALLIPCLSGSNYQVFAVGSVILDFYDLVNCTKIRNIYLPRERMLENHVYLAWRTPACGHCAGQGRRCSLQNSVGKNQVQCVDIPNANKGAVEAPVIAGTTLGSILILIILGAFFKFHRSYIIETEYQRTIKRFLEDYKALKPTRFSYSDIRRITDQFKEKLGEGEYGIVYKGKISKDLMNVAVKVLKNSKGDGEDFVNEIGTIGRVHHFNVVRLVGFCAEGYRRALVYEFLPNDSLEKFIFEEGSQRSLLGWKGLRDIALGIAKGIEYLHQGCDQQILHFDIKPHNILLDCNFNPKISDFGLAKWCSKEQSAVTMTAARGTMGYMAPEVLSRTFGKVSHKSDIYSYGMLLLEIVGGRKNVDLGADTSQVYYPHWIYRKLYLGEDFWEQVKEAEDGNIARKLAIVALWCIQWCPADRPSMKEVVQMLEDDGDDITVPPNPFPAMNANDSVEDKVGGHYLATLPVILETE